MCVCCWEPPGCDIQNQDQIQPLFVVTISGWEVVKSWYLHAYTHLKVRLQNFLVEYTTFNTHIGFAFKLNDTDHALHVPQVQSINTQWTNVASIYHYTLSEFENLIFGLQNNETPVYEIIQKTIREGSNIVLS